jgi:hypothetical protein
MGLRIQISARLFALSVNYSAASFAAKNDLGAFDANRTVTWATAAVDGCAA